jgi:phosphoglycerate dehydrogenase-like enzyme
VRVVVAIHDPPVWTIPESEVDRLRRALPGDEVGHVRDNAGRPGAFADADVLFATRLNAEEYAETRRLKWIHSSAVGVGPLLPPALVESPVVVSNSRGVHSATIAEHAVALVLALRRQLHLAVRRQEARIWAQVELYAPVVPALEATEVLVVGLGTIGARVAAHCAGLGMRVVGVRRQMDAAALPGVSKVLPPDRLLEGLAHADVVVLAVPRTEATRALIGRAELAGMKPSSMLVNVARGRLVDEDALADALERGTIGCAGLDAFQTEPLPAGHRLWGLPNVLITPHSASFAGDYWTPVVDLFLENVARFRLGAPLVNVVDKALGY